MCGRFALGIPRKRLAEHFEVPDLPEAPARYNIAPTQLVEAVTADKEGRRHARLFHWGLIPFWAKDKSIGNKLINARAEGVADKPAFRAAFRHRRCLIPAQAFYEWAKVPGGRQPYAIMPKGGEPMGLAGLWESWSGPGGEEIESCTIVTCPANELLAKVHDRMPVVLPRESYGAWLDPEHGDRSGRLLAPYPAELLRAYPVTRAVNSPAHDAPDCLYPQE